MPSRRSAPDPVTRRPTMSDVAARAGVSLKTVSRVVNGEAHVRPAVAGRVDAAIAELGYRPDGRARDLATSRTPRTVGFVQVDAANPFFAAVHRGLEDVLSVRGLMIIAGSTDADPDRERRLLETLIEFRVDGLVVAAAEGSDDLLSREIEHGTPLVCVDRILPWPVCDTVVADNRDSTRTAVEHLRAHGHHRIAFLGGDVEVWTARERLAGFRDAMADGDAEPLVVTHVDTVERARAATHQLVTGDRPPTALFTAQDRISVGAITALHELAMQGEVALFGFDELPFAEQLVPSISVIAQDPYRMGRRAAELLLDRFAAPDADTVFDVVDTPLRHRGSGSIPPPGDRADRQPR